MTEPTRWSDADLDELLAVTDRAARLKNARLNEARSTALLRFHAVFEDPATVAALIRQLRSERDEVQAKLDFERNDPRGLNSLCNFANAQLREARGKVWQEAIALASAELIDLEDEDADTEYNQVFNAGVSEVLTTLEAAGKRRQSGG